MWHIFDIYQEKQGVYFRKKYIFVRFMADNGLQTTDYGL